MVDLGGTGGGDIITGKRFRAHGAEGLDSETKAPAVLYAFRRVRHGNRHVDYVPILIDSDSGVGTQVGRWRCKRRWVARYRRQQQERDVLVASAAAASLTVP